MSEALGNSTAPPRDACSVLRATALSLLFASVCPLPGARREALADRAIAATPRARSERAVARLRGRVLLEGGAAAQGARVDVLYLRDGLSWRVTDTTVNAQGDFETGPVPPGTAQLVVTLADATRALIRVEAEGETTVPTLRLAPAGRIEGTLTALRGARREPLAGAWVRAVREGGDDAWPFVARADAQGRFALEGLPQGVTWRVELDAPGHERVRRVGVPSSRQGLDLVARALATIEGVVRDAHGGGAGGARVTIVGSGIWPSRQVPLLHDGRFVLNDVPAGVYELRAARDLDVADPIAPLSIEAGGREEVTLTLARGGSVSGVVRDAASGGGIAGARLIVTEDSIALSPNAIVSDAGGRFSVSGLVRRPHRVAVHAPGYATQQGVIAPVDAPMDIRLDRGVSIAGRLLDPRGAPIAGARVELVGEDLDGRAVWWSGATVAFRDALFDAQVRGPRPLEPRGELGVTRGRVPMIPLEPVPLGIEAERSAPGWTTDLDGRFEIRDAPPGLLRVALSHAAYVRAESEARSLRAGASWALELVAHEGGAVEGRVLTDRGFPLSGVQVELRADSETASRRVFTSRDGSFRAPSLLGRVALVAWLQGRVAARGETVVADGSVSVVNLTVPGSLRHVSGRVVDARGFGVAGAALAITSLERAALGTIQTFSQNDGTFDTVIGGTRGVSIEVRHPDHAPHGLRVEDPTRPLRIELDPGATLSARVSHDGCAEGDGVAELRTPCGPTRATWGREETTRFERLCAGRATLVLTAPGCVTIERAVQLPARGVVRLESLELRAGGGVSGEVVDAEGDAVAGAEVRSLEGGVSVRTGRRGEFSAAAMPVGDIELVASHPALGRSVGARVRVLRGTVARGVLIRMERSPRDATRVVASRALTLGAGDGDTVLVREVREGSSAERAGVRPGDAVLSIGADAVRGTRDAERRLAGPPGDDVVLELERDGRRRTVRFVRESR